MDISARIGLNALRDLVSEVQAWRAQLPRSVARKRGLSRDDISAAMEADAQLERALAAAEHAIGRLSGLVKKTDWQPMFLEV